MRAVRCRWLIAPSTWDVRARVERFDEPALLLLLRDGERHGYELADALGELVSQERRVDLGNLYRMLRALEAEGVLASQRRADLPGPAKRTYELTTVGEDCWMTGRSGWIGLRSRSADLSSATRKGGRT
jgi:DNA-binding PadR family transcriptional regulator